ncbi:response regulator [Alteriqipengyuania lutimaris]|uniref:response regulator n=1 Tax=Alteriqipengyuania lutimaris TaxID=1538146 RepID=UPI001CFD7969|nr:response regulator [Alteriqipengyuania lutimaris]
MVSDWADLPPEAQIELLSRRLARAERALEDAEAMLDNRMRELDRANKDLRQREGELVERLDIENQKLLSAQRLAELATIYVEHGRHFTASENFAVLLGYPEGTIISKKRLGEAIHPLDRQRFTSVARNAFASLEPDKDHTFQHRILGPDGEVRWLDWHVRRESTPVDGQYVVFATARDVTESRTNARRVRALQLRAERRVKELDRLADALRKAQAETGTALEKRNRFISEMAHRIRTPMGGLIGAMELLVRRYPGDELANRGLDAADNLAAIADQLITTADETGTRQREDRPVPASAPTGEFTALRTADGKAPKILLAEDTESNAFVITQLVEMLGGEVTTVTNGRDAVEAVRKGGFDAVLMDVMMPIMTGEEATVAIRALPGPEARVPIIGISAHSLQAERESLLTAGMSKCLVKPIRRDALDAALRAALSADNAQAGEAVLFDIEVFLEAFLVLPPSFRQKMLDAFRKDLGKNGEALASAILAGDDEGTDRLAHSLKGICLNVGAVAMVDQLAEIRSAPVDQRESMVTPLRDTIAASLAACDDLYDERVAQAQ